MNIQNSFALPKQDSFVEHGGELNGYRQITTMQLHKTALKDLWTSVLNIINFICIIACFQLCCTGTYLEYGNMNTLQLQMIKL